MERTRRRSFRIYLNIVMILIGLAVIVVGARGILSNPSSGETETSCIDVHNVASFVYDVCFDAYSDRLFVELVRNQDSYTVHSLTFSFFDYEAREEVVEDAPSLKESRRYVFSAQKNPTLLSVSLQVEDSFSVPICEAPREISVPYCTLGNSDSLSAEVKPFGTAPISNFTSIGSFSGRSSSDYFSLDLVDKKRIWSSSCTPDWECSPWEVCVDDVRKRTCIDTRKCPFSVGSPSTSMSCTGVCQENWQCSWAVCSGGYTEPTCTDLNQCGTEFSRPVRLSCGSSTSSCTPQFDCSSWSACKADYGFSSLIQNSVISSTGSQKRVCTDQNSCAQSTTQTQPCSTGEDIFTKKFVRCGKPYIGIYTVLSGELIAWMDDVKGIAPQFNIRFGGEEDLAYCDHCFDGRKSGDETALDCGGSCKACTP